MLPPYPYWSPTALYSAVAGQGQLVMLAGEQAGRPDKTAEYNAKANASRSRR